MTRVAALLLLLLACAPAAAQIFIPAPRAPEAPEPARNPAADPAADPAGAGDGGIEGAALPDPDPAVGSEDAAPGRPGFVRAPFSTPERPEIILGPAVEARHGARLRRLDKMTGASETVEIAAGAEVDFGRLRVAVAACMAPVDGSAEGTRAFLSIRDERDGAAPVFSGWMFADSPALSALDHPRFDVWLISCTTS